MTTKQSLNRYTFYLFNRSSQHLTDEEKLYLEELWNEFDELMELCRKEYEDTENPTVWNKPEEAEHKMAN